MMEYNFFALISRMKYIDRWALMRNNREENLCEHCLEVSTSSSIRSGSTAKSTLYQFLSGISSTAH